MNIFFRITLLSLFMCLSSWCLANVTVQWNNKHYVFDTQPRLANLLAGLKIHSNSYWPAAALYKKNDQSLEQTRQSVLKTLATLISEQSLKVSETKQILEQLHTEIAAWQLARRLNVVIDYDLARISPANNPQFDNGEYFLYLTQRPKEIELFGAIKKNKKLNHIGYSDVSEYIASVELFSISEQSVVTLIQANGSIIEAPVAYWNKQHQEIMPGSLIYIPFKESIFSNTYTELNQKIVHLAQNRLPE